MTRYLLTIIICLMPLCMSGASTGTHEWAASSVLSDGQWVKIALNDRQDAIYQITYGQLRDWGFSKPEQVAVYGYGGHKLSENFATPHTDDLPEVAVMHDSSRQRILFYGQGTLSWKYNQTNGRYIQNQHPYAKRAYYFLHQKDAEEGAPLEIGTQETMTGTPDAILDEYDEVWLHEQDLVNLGQTGQEWYGESFLSTQSQSFSLPEEKSLAGHTLKAGTASLTVRFAAKANSATKFSVRLNDKVSGTATVSATTNTYGFASESELYVEKGNDTDIQSATVKVTYQPSGAAPTVARLNYISLQGKCPLTASAQEPYMLFRNAEAIDRHVQYSIGGMSDKLTVWDVTDGIRPETVTGSAGPADKGSFTFMAKEKGLRQYAVVNTSGSGFPTVSRAGTVAHQNLHAIEPVDMVIVTAPALRRYAVQLAEYRLEHDNLSSVIVTPEEIYNEYSSGTPDATAIRLFLKQLYDRGNISESESKLRYLLLFGDGTYDNRSASESNYLLPTYQGESSLVETSSCVTDDYYGFLDDSDGCKLDAGGRLSLTSDILDIGVGRITVTSASQAEKIVSKIIGYDGIDQRGSWKNRLCFLSDDDKIESSGTDSPNLHIRHNETLIDSLQRDGHYEYLYQKIYLPAYQRTMTASGTDYPDARKELNSALQQGMLLLNYAGHGAAGLITNEQIMNTQIASELRMKHLPVWITASCDVSRFDADVTSMGETLLLNPNGGAAALISTTRVVYAHMNLKLNSAIVKHLFDRNEDGSRFRLGDIIRAAKAELGMDYNKLNFCLLGDPSMTLAFPEQQLVIDEVKGTFEPLNTVSLKGRVLLTDASDTDTTFNGLLYTSIYDAEQDVTADKGLYQDPVYTFKTRNRKLFTGRDVIRGGEFEFSFVVPEDASADGGFGLVNLYACSEDGEEAQGYYKDFRIQSSETPHVNDTVAPVIMSCFIDSPSFKSGDKVGSTPYFYAEVSDSTGISATGNSIGHDISLYIRCLSNPMIANSQVILNNYFTTFTGQPGRGNVQYSLPRLEEGTYEATFRVWDVCGNTSSRTFTFTVSADAAPHIELVQAYPSPAHQGETVTFRVLHNRPESADQLRLQIFTQLGVKVLDKTISSTSSEVVYLKDGATDKTQISHQLNADETDELMGSTTMTWQATVAPGVYVYRAFLSSGGSESASQSKILIIL
ncbi:MAG: type IX secretion system sortase PorU [Bacteroidales bacterium]|nr:type IX secretion system sortase PorU [Candidatus Liminaster caballi]